MITFRALGFKDQINIRFLKMIEIFENFTQEEQKEFLHQLKDSKKVKINNTEYEFDGLDYTNFKRYNGVAVKR